ncbi:MAG TPA: copper-binding protein [Candidatus Acidoferrales bacterium]|nr:copper-binding protein [Candidatus Acidoferrales bacterium]
MKFNDDFFAVTLLVLAGCAAYEPPPLTASHPAHPDAAVSPARFVSKTLAYTKADRAPAEPVAAAQAETHGQQHGAPLLAGPTVVGEGKVIATVPNASQIVVEHGEIKGFMEAMTMGYRVDPPSLLEGLKFGDQVRFTIDVPKKAIVKIEKLN